MSETGTFHYRAFLSYSHRDTPWAKWLHSALEGYRVEKDLVGRETPAGPVPRNLRPVFRDREDFSAGHSLTEQTSAALEGSQFMVVLCSPNAAKSQYVNEEIRRYKGLGRGDYVIPLIVDGEPGDPEQECFPPALRFKIGPDGALTDEHEEPIAADARPQADGKDGAKLKLVAGILGLGFDEIVRRAERSRRRRLRNWVGALSLLTVTFAGLAVWAEINRREANVQRAHAVAALDAATKTANSLTYGLATRFRNTAGIPQALVKEIIERALYLQQQLASSGQTSPELQASEAGAYVEASLTLMTVGDRQGAFAAADKARQIFENLVAANPGDMRWAPDLALSYQRMGDALVAAGKLDEALTDYRKALAIYERMAKDDPDKGGLQIGLSTILNKLGDVSSMQGNHDEALKFYQRSAAVAQALVARDPTNAEWQRQLAVCYEREGDALVGLQRYDEALEAFRKRLAIAKQVSTADAANTEWMRDLEIAYNKIGDVLTETGKAAEALDPYQQRLKIAEQLANADSGNRLWQRDLAIAHNKMGNAFSAAGRNDEALTSYQAGLDIEQKLATTDPGNAQWQRDMFVSYAMMAGVLKEEGKTADAIAAMQEGLAIAEKLADADADNPQAQYEVAVANWQLAALGDDTERRLKLIVTILGTLNEQQRLQAGQAKLLAAAQAALDKAKTGQN